MNVKNNTIYRTTDYGMFKRLEGNRTVPETRVRKIIKSIESVGYVQSPLCVNENYEVIDGQGRLEALKRLGLPVDYFIVKNVGIDECIALNIYQTNWSMNDYINSYAESGNNSYIYLQQLIKAFPEMSLRVIHNAITGKAESGNLAIKSGSYSCTSEDYDKAGKILRYEERFRKFFDRLHGKSEFYYVAIAFCFRHPEVNDERLIDKVEQRQAELIPVSNIEQALGMLEKIYNHRSRDPVYLVTDYKKYNSKKYKWYEKRYV